MTHRGGTNHRCQADAVGVKTRRSSRARLTTAREPAIARSVVLIGDEGWCSAVRIEFLALWPRWLECAVCFIVERVSRPIFGLRVRLNIRTDVVLRRPRDGAPWHIRGDCRFTSVRSTQRLNEIGARTLIGTIADHGLGSGSHGASRRR